MRARICSVTDSVLPPTVSCRGLSQAYVATNYFYISMMIRQYSCNIYILENIDPTKGIRLGYSTTSTTGAFLSATVFSAITIGTSVMKAVGVH